MMINIPAILLMIVLVLLLVLLFVKGWSRIGGLPIIAMVIVLLFFLASRT